MKLLLSREKEVGRPLPLILGSVTILIGALLMIMQAVTILMAPTYQASLLPVIPNYPLTVSGSLALTISLLLALCSIALLDGSGQARYPTIVASTAFCAASLLWNHNQLPGILLSASLALATGSMYLPSSRAFFQQGSHSLGLLYVILRREFLTRPRSKRFYWKRSVFVFLVAGIIGYGVYETTAGDTSTIGLKIFNSLAMTTLVTMLFIPIYSASSSIIREKEDRTLGLLFLSDISAGQFITGKLLTSILSTLLIIGSVFPLFILSVSLGGVSSAQITIAFLVLLSTILLGTCLGLFIASLTQHTRTTNSLVILTCLNLFLFLPLVVLWIYSANDMGSEEYLPVLSVISPFVAMMHILEDSHVAYTTLAPVFNVVIAFPFLVLAHRILPGTVMQRSGDEHAPEEEPPSPTPETSPETTRTETDDQPPPPTKKVPIRRIHTLTYNPVYWKELYIEQGGTRGVWLRCLLTLAVVMALVAAVVLIAGGDMHDLFDALPLILALFGSVVFTLGVLAGANKAFSRETRDRTLDILLTTPMQPSLIIDGKLRAILYARYPWLIVALSALLIKVFLDWGYEPESILNLALIPAAGFSMLVFHSIFGAFLSLRTRREIGLAISIIALLLYNIPLRFYMSETVDHWSFITHDWMRPYGGYSSVHILAAIDIALHGCGAVFLRRHMINEFRRLALRTPG